MVRNGRYKGVPQPADCMARHANPPAAPVSMLDLQGYCAWCPYLNKW